MYGLSDESLKTTDPALALRREILVSALFKYVSEVREMEDGYAFKFRSGRLITRRIADYVLFEGLHSPQMSFMVIAEPNGKELWLLVQGGERLSPSGHGPSPSLFGM